MANIEGVEVRRIRKLLKEDQTAFGKRFGVTRRTIIRWEKSGHNFPEWGGWLREDKKTPADLWRDLVKQAAAGLAPRRNPKRKNSSRKGVAGRPKAKKRARRQAGIKKPRGRK